MDWTDPTQLLLEIEAYARNWLVWLGSETGLPLLGKDWELVAVAIIALVALWIWFWPTRRAFRNRSLLRWLVAALNIGAIWLLPLWLFALVLSSIRRSSVPAGVSKPVVPRTAMAQGSVGMPAVLRDVVKVVSALAARRQAGAKGLGPWGKHAKPAPAGPSAPVPASTTAARPAAHPATAQRATPAPSRPGRGSSLPNRETWIRRRG